MFLRVLQKSWELRASAAIASLLLSNFLFVAFTVLVNWKKQSKTTQKESKKMTEGQKIIINKKLLWWWGNVFTAYNKIDKVFGSKVME